MTNAQSVAVIGDALIDEIHDHAGVRELVGGAALNVAVGLRRLGVPVTLIAMVGDDEAGAHIRQYLSDHDVRLIASHAPRGSSRAIVQRRPNGEPEYTFNDAAQHRSIRFDAAARDAVADAGLVVVSCFPFDDATEVQGLADAVASTPLIIDPNPRSGMLQDRAAFVQGFERLAAGAELVKVGADDAALLYDTDVDTLRRRLREIGAASVLATSGADGAVLETDAGTFRAPITVLPGAVIDTVGAGDATLAAAAAGLAEKYPASEEEWQALLERAMAIAAATCRTEGGLLQTPQSMSAAWVATRGS